jgi:hypothetical protein
LPAAVENIQSLFFQQDIHNAPLHTAMRQ